MCGRGGGRSTLQTAGTEARTGCYSDRGISQPSAMRAGGQKCRWSEGLDYNSWFRRYRELLEESVSSQKLLEVGFLFSVSVLLFFCF